MLSPEAITYYKQHEPIGCRDTHTLELLNSCGIRAYFSGCLTLALRPRHIRRSNHIILVDVPSEIANLVPADLKDRVRFITHISTTLDRFQHAARILDLYSSAQLVITTRLHCALPCVAFGTPVLFVRRDFNDPRFGGLAKLLPCASLSEIAEGCREIEWDPQPYRHPDLSAITKQLVTRCETFIAS